MIYIYIYTHTYQELVNAVSYIYHTLSKNSSLGSRSPAFLGGPTLRKGVRTGLGFRGVVWGFYTTVH